MIVVAIVQSAGFCEKSEETYFGEKDRRRTICRQPHKKVLGNPRPLHQQEHRQDEQKQKDKRFAKLGQVSRRSRRDVKLASKFPDPSYYYTCCHSTLEFKGPCGAQFSGRIREHGG